VSWRVLKGPGGSWRVLDKYLNILIALIYAAAGLFLLSVHLGITERVTY
jgi:hypothetical protein